MQRRERDDDEKSTRYLVFLSCSADAALPLLLQNEATEHTAWVKLLKILLLELLFVERCDSSSRIIQHPNVNV